jgi:hypothetical protein
MDMSEPTTTQLRDYYQALGALHQGEQTLLAEAHAEDPSPLIHRFQHSVKEARRRLTDPVEPFHGGSRKQPADPPVPLAKLKTTFESGSSP